jgi:DNA-binding CsgD family transcriptional regulator
LVPGKERRMLSLAYIKMFIYLSAGFIGLMNIAFLLFLTKYKDSGNRRLYRATRNFSFSALLLVVLYFLFLFMRFVFGELENNSLLRVFDILAFVGLKYFWLKIIMDIIEIKNGVLQRTINVLFLIFAVLCVINFGFFMDSQYYIANGVIRGYVTAVNLLFSTIPLAINLYILIRYYHQMVNKLDVVFIVSNSLLIHLNALWNSLMAISLYYGKLVLSTWITPISDPTSIFLFLINLNLFIFIYRKDFSPLFKLSAEGTIREKKEVATDQEILDILAFKHALTVREREVAYLVYQGYTNPDIADRLFISRNTVRNHIHNIFYKMDVSTRMELVHLVNSQR